MKINSVKNHAARLLCLGMSLSAAAAPVTFKVDMAVAQAGGSFVPGNGDTVSAVGTFQNPNQWSAGAFILTNIPGTTFYQNTYNDTNPPGTLEGYKFVSFSARNGYAWEINFGPNATGNNRTFTTSSQPQALPLVYFNDLAPSSGVPTNPVVFQVDMSVQITAGTFVPANGDQVEVRGLFQTPNQWSGGFTLTNSPGNPNVYRGAYPDANHPGTYESYKFVIAQSGGGAVWEGLPNRTYVLQTNGQTLPGAYFNNESPASVPVTFQVDMSQQIANGNFNPVNGDIVQARGTFQSFTTWTGGFTLASSGGNPSVYTGVYSDTHAPGTAEQYKYVIVKAGDDINSWNNSEVIVDAANNNNRAFVLATNAQTLPAVYFSNLSGPSPVVFQVDMTEQILAGSFNPSVDNVAVLGDFDHWSGGLQLTNDPGAANPNLYTGTWVDVNDAPGVTLNYKFIIDYSAWEARSDRSFVLQSGGQTLPAVYFSDLSPSSTPVTFQVDMSVAASLGQFNPANGDYVEVRGTFENPNSWYGGLQLTNNPASGNPYLFSGTFPDYNVAGTVEAYKFVVDGGSGLGWEQLSAGNRYFTLAGGPQTLAPVYFNDRAPGAVLTADTLVTFSVDMTGAVGTDGHVFDPSADNIYINGDFLGWPAWNTFLPQATNNPIGSSIYTLTWLIPAGSPLSLNYTYGINGQPDEAAYGVNHVHYILQTGSYTLPQDTFGTMASETLTSLTVRPDDTLRLAVSPLNPNGDRRTFALAAGAPAGATINSTNGILQWHPGRGNASTTQYITVSITDLDVPALSSLKTLIVKVLDYLDLTVGAIAVEAGNAFQLPVTIASSDTVTDLTFAVNWPTSQLPVPTLTAIAPASGSLQNQTTNLLVHLWTASGQAIIGTAQVAQLHSQTAPSSASGFLPVTVASLGGTKPGAVVYANTIGESGEVAVIGGNPFLRAGLAAGNRTLQLYGHVGTNYAVQFTTNLTAGWSLLQNYTQTSSQQALVVGATNPVIFYRLRQ